MRQWKSKEWEKYDWEYLWLKSIYSNSKFNVTIKNADFDCWYIRNHTKDKPSKISNIEVAMANKSYKILIQLKQFIRRFLLPYSSLWWNWCWLYMSSGDVFSVANWSVNYQNIVHHLCLLWQQPSLLTETCSKIIPLCDVHSVAYRGFLATGVRRFTPVYTTPPAPTYIICLCVGARVV